MKFTKQEKSWILYDWANSVYATVMLAAIFPIYFTQVCGATGADGDFWWSLGSSIATAVIAVCAPFLGAIGDFQGMKKKLFTVFLVIGLLFTASCAVLDQWQGLLVGYIFSYIGYAGSCMFYDSMLTDVTTDERMDMVSSWGYSMGYIGGSTLPFLVCIALITMGANFGIDGTMAVKLSVVITVVWWAIFTIPLLRDCEQLYGKQAQMGKMMRQSLHGLRQTFHEITQNRGMFLYIIAYFFYIDGVNTVIKMSTAYGTALGLDSTGMILALLVTQIIAFFCAIGFGRLTRIFGTIRMLQVSVWVYVLICVVGFVMGFGIEQMFLTVSQALVLFWVLAVLVGTVQGGIQALSRSYFGKMIPKEKSNEYFGVFDIFGKFSCILGPAIYAVVKGTTGQSSYAIVSIALLFLVGLGILTVGKAQIEHAANAQEHVATSTVG